MPILSSAQAKNEAILTAARLIMAAITTSPKARGVSSVCSVLIQGEEKERLAKAMEDHARRKSINKEIFPRDAKNIRCSEAVLLIGVKGPCQKNPRSLSIVEPVGTPRARNLSGRKRREERILSVPSVPSRSWTWASL